jgi:hypothetical protein
VIEDLGDYCMCVDQGFTRTGALYDKFVGPLSKTARKKLSPVLSAHLIRRHQVYISLRQASEWGMKSLQGTFSRLKTRLPSHRMKRRNIMHSIILLHNYRISNEGLNRVQPRI